MTNRQYLAKMDDKELAMFIYGGKESMKRCTTCKRYNAKSFCENCIMEWLKAKGKPQRGDVRKEKNIDDSGGYYMIVAVNGRSYDVMFLNGEFGCMMSTDVENDETVNMTTQEFLKITMNLATGGNYTEYGEGAARSFDNFICNYEYLYSKEEYLEDGGLTESEFDKDLYIKSLVDRLEQETTVLHLPNGNYIVFWNL